VNVIFAVCTLQLHSDHLVRALSIYANKTQEQDNLNLKNIFVAAKQW